MDSTVLVGLLSLIGTLAGTLGGIYVSNRLVVYRVEKLEESIQEMNRNVTRIYELEKTDEIQNTRLDNLEEEQDRIIIDIREIKKAVK